MVFPTAFIYHMPVIYVSLHWEIDGLQRLGLVTLTVVLLIIASWCWVERQALCFNNTGAQRQLSPYGLRVVDE